MSSVNTVFLLPDMLSVDCGQAFFLLLVSRFHLYLVLAHARLLLLYRLVIREQRCALAVALAHRRRSCIRKRVQAQLPVLRQRSQHLEVAQLSRIRSNASWDSRSSLRKRARATSCSLPIELISNKCSMSTSLQNPECVKPSIAQSAHS